MEDNNTQGGPVIRETHERLPRRWLLLALYAILALIIAIIVVFGIRAIYRHDHRPVKPAPAKTQKRPSIPQTNSSSKASSTTKSTAANTSTSLPNSGPGSVVGLFIGSFVAAAGLHYLVNFQRATKNRAN